MGINVWRVAKALLYSIVIIAMAIVALHFDANPTWIGVISLTGVLVVFLGEVKEIQVAHFVTVVFKNGTAKSDDES